MCEFWSAQCVLCRFVWRIRCLFSFPLLTRQLILCTGLCVPDSRRGMHHGSRKSHVSILSRMVADTLSEFIHGSSVDSVGRPFV